MVSNSRREYLKSWIQPTVIKKLESASEALGSFVKENGPISPELLNASLNWSDEKIGKRAIILKLIKQNRDSDQQLVAEITDGTYHVLCIFSKSSLDHYLQTASGREVTKLRGAYVLIQQARWEFTPPSNRRRTWTLKLNVSSFKSLGGEGSNPSDESTSLIDHICKDLNIVTTRATHRPFRHEKWQINTSLDDASLPFSVTAREYETQPDRIFTQATSQRNRGGFLSALSPQSQSHSLRSTHSSSGLISLEGMSHQDVNLFEELALGYQSQARIFSPNSESTSSRSSPNENRSGNGSDSDDISASLSQHSQNSLKQKEVPKFRPLSDAQEVNVEDDEARSFVSGTSTSPSRDAFDMTFQTQAEPVTIERQSPLDVSRKRDRSKTPVLPSQNGLLSQKGVQKRHISSKEIANLMLSTTGDQLPSRRQSSRARTAKGSDNIGMQSMRLQNSNSPILDAESALQALTSESSDSETSSNAHQAPQLHSEDEILDIEEIGTSESDTQNDPQNSNFHALLDEVYCTPGSGWRSDVMKTAMYIKSFGSWCVNRDIWKDADGLAD